MPECQSYHRCRQDAGNDLALVTAVRAVRHVEIKVVLGYLGHSLEAALPPIVNDDSWPMAALDQRPLIGKRTIAI
jgi:hypothetical protein